MVASASAERPAGGDGPSAATPPSWSAQIGALLHQLPGLIGDRIELLALELQRAGHALTQVVILVVATAILGVTAWIVLWGAVVAVLVTLLGMHWLVALLIVLVINAFAAAMALLRARRLLGHLGLPATRRHLSFGAASRPPAEPASPA